MSQQRLVTRKKGNPERAFSSQGQAGENVTWPPFCTSSSQSHMGFVFHGCSRPLVTRETGKRGGWLGWGNWEKEALVGKYLMSSHHIVVHIICLHPYLNCFAYFSSFTCLRILLLVEVLCLLKLLELVEVPWLLGFLRLVEVLCLLILLGLPGVLCLL